MKNFLLKSLIFVVLFFSIDFIISKFISYGAINRQNDRRLDKLLNGEFKYDVLIMGSSRASYDIIPKEIINSTKLSTFNFGYPGSNIDFHETLLRLVINSGQSPKYLILVLDDNKELLENKDLKYRFDALFPYTKNDSIKEILIGRNKKNFLISKVSNTYNENQNLIPALYYLTSGAEPFDPLNNIQSDGSMPIPSTKSKISSFGLNKPPYKIKDESRYLRNKFMSFTRLCKLKKIQLIYLLPPNFYNPTSNFYNRMKHLAGPESLFINYSGIKLPPTMFFDKAHLNEDGAILISRKLSEEIKSILKQSEKIK
jgi:hypothetical protein